MRLCNYTLSPTRINNAKAKDKRYKLSDGGGLFVEVSPAGQKTWRYQNHHHEMAEERRRALQYLADQIDRLTVSTPANVEVPCTPRHGGPRPRGLAGGPQAGGRSGHHGPVWQH